MEYIIVIGKTPDTLATQVQEKLDEGWELQGGIAVDTEDYCYQAMTSEVP